MFSLRSHSLYIQLSPHTITVHVPRLGVTVRDAADIAIAQRSKYRVVAAVGTAASVLRGSANVQVFSPFAHPRSVVNNVEAAEALLRHLIKQTLGVRWLTWAPSVVLHPLGDYEGGLTDVEMSALRAMATGAGAGKVHIWLGRVLRDAEVLAAPQPCAQGMWH